MKKNKQLKIYWQLFEKIEEQLKHREKFFLIKYGSKIGRLNQLQSFIFWCRKFKSKSNSEEKVKWRERSCMMTVLHIPLMQESDQHHFRFIAEFSIYVWESMNYISEI